MTGFMTRAEYIKLVDKSRIMVCGMCERKTPFPLLRVVLDLHHRSW